MLIVKKNCGDLFVEYRKEFHIFYYFPIFQVVGLQAAFAGTFNMLGGVVDEQGFVRVQLLLLYDSPEAFLLGFADMQDMGEIGGFEDGLEKVKTKLLLQMGREAVIVELVGVAEQVKIVLFFQVQ